MPAEETVTLTRDPTRTTSGGSDAPTVEVAIPKRLGSVELIRELGKGGMGVVWLGRHEMLNREVAVKFLLHVSEGEEDPGFVAFLEGARAAAALRHKGLNSVVHADVIERVPFIVMDYVEGPTLAQVLHRGGPLSPAAARVVLEDSCEAVAELHDHNIVHRDIKPANILLSGDGTAVLTDFGLACSRPVLGLSSKVEGVAGTPAYMAPEMFDRSISPRSDVYALGIMAYELLLGRPPFDGSLAEMRRCHREVEFPSVDLVPFHPALADALDRATNKNPMFRLKSGRHLLMALQDAFGQMDQVRVNRARGEQELGERIRKAQGGASGGGAVTPTPEGATYYDRLGTLVQKRRSDDQATPADDLIERVKHDLACVRCGTALKGEPLTGRCPGCLLLVRKSTEPASAMDASAASSGGSGASAWVAPAQPAQPAPLSTAPKAAAPAPPPETPKREGFLAGMKKFWQDFTGR